MSFRLSLVAYLQLSEVGYDQLYNVKQTNSNWPKEYPSMTLFTSSLCFAPSVVGASSDKDPQREEERLSRQQVFRFMSYNAAM